MKFYVNVERLYSRVSQYEVECDSVEQLKEAIAEKAFDGPLPRLAKWTLLDSLGAFQPIDQCAGVTRCTHEDLMTTIPELLTKENRLHRLHDLVHLIDGIMTMSESGEFSGADVVEALFELKDRIREETKAVRYV